MKPPRIADRALGGSLKALLHTIDLLPLHLEDSGIQLSELEVATESRGPLAIVYYNDNGEPQDYGLRLDLEKQSFLDLDSFRDRWGSEEGLNRANSFVRSLSNLVSGLVAANPAG